MEFYKIPRATPVPTKIMIQDKARVNVWNNYERREIQLVFNIDHDGLIVDNSICCIF